MHIVPSPQTLLSLKPTINGVVTSIPTAITFPGTCTSSFNFNQSVALYAQPISGYCFAGFNGDCLGQSPYQMNKDRSCTANFARDDWAGINITDKFIGEPSYTLDGDDTNINDAIDIYRYEFNHSKRYADLTLDTYRLRSIYKDQDRGVYSARVNDGWQAESFRIESGTRGPLIPAGSPNNKIYYVNLISGALSPSQWIVYYFDNNLSVSEALTENFPNNAGSYNVLFDNNMMTISYEGKRKCDIHFCFSINWYF